jgi:hypothetical protein
MGRNFSPTALTGTGMGKILPRGDGDGEVFPNGKFSVDVLNRYFFYFESTILPYSWFLFLRKNIFWVFYTKFGTSAAHVVTS